MPRRRSTRALTLALATLVVLSPGCIIGSPVAAFSGEPYGMTIDDVRAVQGRNGRIWSNAPGFAVIDFPFAVVLDTCLLPISLLMWCILEISDGGDHGDDEEVHDYEE